MQWAVALCTVRSGRWPLASRRMYRAPPSRYAAAGVTRRCRAAVARRHPRRPCGTWRRRRGPARGCPTGHLSNRTSRYPRERPEGTGEAPRPSARCRREGLAWLQDQPPEMASHVADSESGPDAISTKAQRRRRAIWYCVADWQRVGPPWRVIRATSTGAPARGRAPRHEVLKLHCAPTRTRFPARTTCSTRPRELGSCSSPVGHRASGSRATRTPR